MTVYSNENFARVSSGAGGGTGVLGANHVLYTDPAGQVTDSSALTFDGSTLVVTGTVTTGTFLLVTASGTGETRTQNIRVGTAGAANGLNLIGNSTDTAAAIGVSVANSASLTTAGAKLCAVFSDDRVTLKWFVDKDGGSVGFGKSLVDVSTTPLVVATGSAAVGATHSRKDNSSVFGQGVQHAISSAGTAGLFAQIGLGWNGGAQSFFPSVVAHECISDSGSTSGDLIFGTRVLTTDTTPIVRFRIDRFGNIVCGTAALATTATDGFLHIPTCAGTPTGVPTAHTGRVPIVFDTTNAKLYVYSGGAWIGGTTPGAYT